MHPVVRRLDGLEHGLSPSRWDRRRGGRCAVISDATKGGINWKKKPNEHAASNRRSFCEASRSCPLWVISGHRSTFSPCPLYPQKRTLLEPIGMSALCHVWTAPGWQEESSRSRLGRCSHVFGLLNAVHMTAGHNAFRGSGPGQNPAFRSWAPRTTTNARATSNSLSLGPATILSSCSTPLRLPLQRCQTRQDARGSR